MPTHFIFMLQYIINAEIVKVEQLQNFPDIQPGRDGHAVIDHQDEILSLQIRGSLGIHKSV
jgi:hypothetical protein